MYLILAIISSACVSLVMRWSEEKVKSTAWMFFCNYIVCSISAALFMKNSIGKSVWEQTSAGEIRFTIFLGIISGGLYLGTFLILQRNILINGVVLSSIFMKLGVLIPILMAMLVFHEVPGIIQVVGIVLAIGAVIVLHYDKGAVGGEIHLLLLICLLVGGGFTDSMANIFEQCGNALLSDSYLWITFCAAAGCSLLLYLLKREKIVAADFVFGALIGIPNYFSARFLLRALDTVPAVIAYPVYSVATIAVVSLVGVLVFREKLSRRKLVAIFLMGVALGMLT